MQLAAHFLLLFICNFKLLQRWQIPECPPYQTLLSARFCNWDDARGTEQWCPPIPSSDVKSCLANAAVDFATANWDCSDVRGAHTGRLPLQDIEQYTRLK